ADRADRERDPGLASKRALLDPSGDLLERALCRLEQVLTLARPLGGDERVATDDEPLVGILLRGDLGQVLLVNRARSPRTPRDRPRAPAPSAQERLADRPRAARAD